MGGRAEARRVTRAAKARAADARERPKEMDSEPYVGVRISALVEAKEAEQAHVRDLCGPGGDREHRV